MSRLKLGVALLALALLALAGCGGGSSSHSSTNGVAKPGGGTATTAGDLAPAPVQTRADSDKDDDLGTPHDDTSNELLYVGHEAGPSDRHAITALVKRYYAAATSEDGTAACSMLYPTIAESVPEDYGETPTDPPYMKGTTCPAVMALLFKHYHPQLALEAPRLHVALVRIVERHARLSLHFGRLPERQFFVAKQGHAWKIDALLDSEIP